MGGGTSFPVIPLNDALGGQRGTRSGITHEGEDNSSNIGHLPSLHSSLVQAFSALTQVFTWYLPSGMQSFLVQGFSALMHVFAWYLPSSGMHSFLVQAASPLMHLQVLQSSFQWEPSVHSLLAVVG